MHELERFRKLLERSKELLPENSFSCGDKRTRTIVGINRKNDFR